MGFEVIDRSEKRVYEAGFEAFFQFVFSSSRSRETPLPGQQSPPEQAQVGERKGGKSRAVFFANPR
jgi:hypothetical protein